MPQATIEVQYVNPPKEGFSSGSIKCLFPNGKADYIEVHEDMLSDFVKGGTYTVFYIEKTRRTTGKPYKQFQELVSQPVDAKHDTVPPALNHPPYTKQAATAPQKPAGGGFTQAKEIFVTGVVGRAMGSGSFTADHVLELTIAASEAFDVVFAGKPLRGDSPRRASVTPGNIPEPDFVRDEIPPPDPAAYGAGPR